MTDATPLTDAEIDAIRRYTERGLERGSMTRRTIEDLLAKIDSLRRERDEAQRDYTETDAAMETWIAMCKAAEEERDALRRERTALEGVVGAAERAIEIDEHPRSCRGWIIGTTAGEAWHDEKVCDCAISLIRAAIAAWDAVRETQG